MSRREGGGRTAGLRGIRRVVSWVVPFAAFVIILLVLRGAGVPLSVPGVLVVLVLLGVFRVIIGRARRRRRARAVTSPTRTR